MHLSAAGQLAHPAEDGGRRAGRHRNRIVTNGHGLPGREQSDNGVVRPCDDRRMHRNMDEQRRMDVTGTQAQLKVLICRRRNAGGGGGI